MKQGKWLALATLAWCLASSPVRADDYEKALMAVNQQAYEEANIHVRNLLKRQPSHLPAMVLHGEILLNLNLPAEAQKQFEAARDKGADEKLFLVNYLSALMAQSQYQKVIQATQTLPDNYGLIEQAQLLRGQALILSGNGLQARRYLEGVLQSEPSSIALRLALTQVYLDDGDLANAKDSLGRISGAARNVDYWILSGRLAELQQDFAGGVSAYRQALELDANDVEAYKSLAGALLRLEQLEEAESAIEQALAIAGNDPGAIYLHGAILKAKGQHQAANKGLDYISNLISVVDPQTLQANPDLLLVDAMASYTAQDFEQATNKFTLYLQQQPDDLNATVLLAQVHREQGEFAKALAVMMPQQYALQRDEKYALVLALTYMDNQQFDNAQRVLRQHQQRFADDAKATLMLAKMHFDAQRYPQGIAQLQRLRDSYPELAREFSLALAQEGKQRVAADDLLGGYNYLKASAEVVVTDIGGMYQLARVGDALGRSSETVELFTRLVKTYPNNGFLFEILAEQLMTTKEYERSIFYYNQLLTRSLPPIKQAIALNNLSYMHTELKHFDLAIQHAREAIKVRNDIPAFYDTLGWALAQSGKSVEGQQYLQKALSMAGEAPDIKARLDLVKRM